MKFARCQQKIPEGPHFGHVILARAGDGSAQRKLCSKISSQHNSCQVVVDSHRKHKVGSLGGNIGCKSEHRKSDIDKRSYVLPLKFHNTVIILAQYRLFQGCYQICRDQLPAQRCQVLLVLGQCVAVQLPGLASFRVQEEEQSHATHHGFASPCFDCFFATVVEVSIVTIGPM